ncbi:MAG: tryptophan synthase subunit alpha [Gammaproteobacteria bacterium]
MQPREELRQALTLDGAPALIAFVTAGYPEPERFLEVLREIGEAADAVEIGVPFTDPMADGVTVQRASQAALQHGVSLSWIFAQLGSREFELPSPVLLMSYLNPLIAFGYRRLAERALETGVSGFIVPDLPFEESTPLKTELDAQGLALVQLVTPATPAERLRKLCAASEGFVYAVTRTGITGGTESLPEQLTDYLAAVKRASRLPVCAGFGVREREQVRLIAKHADGVIVGSALLEALEAGEHPGAFLAALRP